MWTIRYNRYPYRSYRSIKPHIYELIFVSSRIHLIQRSNHVPLFPRKCGWVCLAKSRMLVDLMLSCRTLLIYSTLKSFVACKLFIYSQDFSTIMAVIISTVILTGSSRGFLTLPSLSGLLAMRSHFETEYILLLYSVSDISFWVLLLFRVPVLHCNVWLLIFHDCRYLI